MRKRSLRSLKEEARSAAEWRGHILYDFVTFKDGNRARSACWLCGAEVDVITDPAPNEIDIGGTAVALNCPVERWP